MIELVTAWTDL